MPTDISNQLGTQRQFVHRPDGLYQGHYQGVSPAGVRDNSQSALQLADNFGRLAVALGNSSLDAERAKKKQGYRDAELLVNSLTDEDRKKLNLIDACQVAGLTHALDNPYFKARAEYLKGQWLSKEMEQDYTNEYGNQPLASMDAERERHDKYMEAWVKRNVYNGQNDPSNQYAFDVGFTESNLINLNKLANSWNAKKHQEDLVNVSAEVQSKLGDIVANAQELLKNNGAMTKEVQTVFNDTRLMGLAPQMRMQLLTDFAKQLVSSGQIDDKRFEQMMDKVIIQTKIDGSKVKAKDLINVTDYKMYANQFRARYLDKESLDLATSWANDATEIQDIDYKVAEKVKEDPLKADYYSSIAQQAKTQFTIRKRREEEEQRRQMEATKDQQKEAENFAKDFQMAELARLGKDTDDEGNTLAGWKFTGNNLYKIITQYKLNQDYESMETLMRLDQAKNYRDMVTGDLMNRLHRIKLNNKGSLQELDKATWSFIKHLATSPTGVSDFYGATLVKEANVLRTLIDANQTGNDKTSGMNQALTMYATYQSARPEVKDEVEKRVKYAYNKKTPVAHIMGTDGADNKYILHKHPDAEVMALKLATIYGLLGSDANSAVDLAAKQISKNFMYYRTAVIPVGVVHSTLSDYKVDADVSTKYFNNAMNSLIVNDLLADKPGINYNSSYLSNVTVRYDSNAQTFSLIDNSNGVSKVYTTSAIINQAKYLYNMDVGNTPKPTPIDTAKREEDIKREQAIAKRDRQLRAVRTGVDFDD